MPREVPVLVGVGQVLQRLEDPRAADEPLALMVKALRLAAADCAAPKLLERADGVSVVRGMWGYGDPGRELGRRLGATPRESVGTPYGGNYAQACVIDAARQIAEGRRGVVLVAGAERGRSAGQAQRLGVTLPESAAPGSPDRRLGADDPIFHEAELARGMNSASDVFAIIESAIRHARGESLAAHAARIAALWADTSRIASGNPHAWLREPHTAGEIGRASPENPMISFPYTRLMNANARVDMAAGVILCSLATALAAGVPESKLVFVHAAAEANEPGFLSERRELHRSPALRSAGEQLLERAGRTLARIDHLDLYSCFPSSLQVAATELGVPEGRPLTVTGGLTFGGGPLNDYGLHAVARMAEVLREERGSFGLVHGNGGWLTKHSVGLYSAEPAPHGFAYTSPQAELDRLPRREALRDWDGPARVEAYTVAHRDGEPRLAYVACLTDDGRRTWATLDDPARLAAMMREEHCGRRGRVDGRGRLELS